MNLLYLMLFVCCGRLLAEICPPDWNRYGESCYFIVKDTMNWDYANRTCAESRATLAVPNSQSEQAYIRDLFLKEFDQHPFTELWIGCNDIEEEGNWQHCPLKGDTNGYENWASGEPNNDFSSDCGTMLLNVNGHWDDYPCTNELYAVCELPVCSRRLTPQCLLQHAMEKSDMLCGKGCRSHLIDNCYHK